MAGIGCWHPQPPQPDSAISVPSLPNCGTPVRVFSVLLHFLFVMLPSLTIALSATDCALTVWFGAGLE